MTAVTLSIIAGTILSLLFSYTPGVESKFKKVTPTKKRLIMLGLLLISSVAVFSLGCLGWGENLGVSLTCDQPGALGLFSQFIVAVIANQSTFSISPKK